MKLRLSSCATVLAVGLLASVPVIMGARADNATPPAPASEPSESTVVGIVTIDGAVVKKVTAGDVKSKLAVLPPQVANAPYDKIYPLLLQSVVAESIINYYAEQAKIKDKPEYAKMVEECKRGAEQKLFLDGKIAERATDERLKQSYEEERQKALKEEAHEYSVSMITVTDQAQARKILKTVKVNTFAEVANKESMTKIPDGNLGYVRLSELPEAFRDKIKNASKATIVKDIIEISLPDPSTPNKKVKTYNILMVQDKRPVTFASFEELKGLVKNKITPDLAKEVIKDLQSKAKIELFGLDGKPLDQKADEASKEDASKDSASKYDTSKYSMPKNDALKNAAPEGEAAAPAA